MAVHRSAAHRRCGAVGNGQWIAFIRLDRRTLCDLAAFGLRGVAGPAGDTISMGTSIRARHAQACLAVFIVSRAPGSNLHSDAILGVWKPIRTAWLRGGEIDPSWICLLWWAWRLAALSVLVWFARRASRNGFDKALVLIGVMAFPAG